MLGILHSSGNPFTNNNTSGLPMSINFTTGSESGDVTLANTVIEFIILKR